MRGQLKINQLFAFIVLDEDGTEGVPAVYNWSTGMAIPLMGADMTRMNQMKELVLKDPTLKGKKITLARFAERENIGTFDRTKE